MPQIIVENLQKTFKVARRQPGLWNSLKSVAHREYKKIAALREFHFN